MPLITDPDLLVDGTEITVSTAAKTITLNIAGNLSTDGVTLKAVYSKLKELWRTNATYIKFPFPMTPITDESFEVVSGWDFANDATRYLIRTGGWSVVNVSGVVTQRWAGVVTLGSIEADDQVYFQQASGGASANFQLTGPVNQAIQVYSDPNGDGSVADGFDRRSFLTLFVRERAQLYDSVNLADIGVSQLAPQVYRFPLTTGADLKITALDAAIAANAPYTGIDITYYGTDQNRTIGAGSYPFRVIIDGNNATAEQIYEKVQYLLRQNSDIDQGAGTVTGKTASDLLRFVGDTLITSTGVYIDNFNASDTNRITFTDQNGVARNFPFVAALTISFGANLVADANAVYRVFFSTLPGAENDFGEAGAIIVDNASGVDMAGSISGQSSITLTFDYDGNVQGGRTAGTDAAITAVAIGLSTGQYVSATGTIARSTANSISLVAALERNYENAA